MKALISVIVPVYKVEDYLYECIDSIVKQTYSNLEIILVDDGSPDNCPSICDEWAKRDTRIKVIHKKNGGLSDARNAGLDIASGEYIAFVDSDDWIAPNMLELMLQAIVQEDADICSCGIVSTYPDHQVCMNVRPIVGNSNQIMEMIYDDTAYPVATWNKLYRKECWDNFRFPIGKICEDTFTTYLLVHHANKIVQISDALYYYRIRENSIMTATFSRKRMDEEEAWRCNYEFMKEHYPHIYKDAYDFYLQKVNILIHEIPREQREKFSVEFQYLHSVLKDNIIYILLFSKLSLKKRVKLILDYIRL